MATIAEVRKQYPQYKDLSDRQLADALHAKFYADIPKAEFEAKVGLRAGSPSQQRAEADARKRTEELGVGKRGGARALVQGAMFGYGDEFTAAVGAVDVMAANAVRRIKGEEIPYTSKEYQNALLQSEREELSRFAAEHPRRNFLGQLGGGLVGGGSAGSAALRGAKSLGGAVARSAAVGAASGAVAGAGYAEGGIRERVPAAAGGAVTGAAFGAAVPVAGRAVQAVPGAVRRAAASVRAPQIDEAAAMRQATEALAEAGIEVRQVSQASMGRIGDLIRRGRNPREAALGVVSTTDLPVPVPMLRGQRTGDPGQQLSENLMLRGARGSAPSRMVRGVVAEQQDALRGNVAAITDNVAAGAPVARGSGGQLASERLNTMYDEAKAGVDTAYDAARATGDGARLPREQMPVLGSQLRQAVETYDLAGVPRVKTELDRIDTIAGSGSVTVRDLFDARARLSNLRASSDQVEAGAARNASRALDAYINRAVTDDLFTGDPQTVNAWRTAIQRRREFGQLFESGDLIESLTERAPRGGEMRALRVDPGDATNYILGRSDMGFVGKQNLYRDLTRLRTVLGPQSQEWNSIRAEVFQRVGSQGEGGVEFGSRQFSGVKFQKAWQDFVRKDPRLAEELFTAEERATIDRFAAIAARVTSPVRGGDNSSNTAVAGARLLGNLKFLRGLPFVKELTGEFEAQVNVRAAARATSPDIGPAPRQPRTTPPSTPPVRPNALIAGYAAPAGANYLASQTTPR